MKKSVFKTLKSRAKNRVVRATKRRPYSIHLKLARLMAVQDKIESVKPFYREQNELIHDLAKKKLPKRVRIKSEYFFVHMMDNFRASNLKWGFAPVRRFEIMLSKQPVLVKRRKK